MPDRTCSAEGCARKHYARSVCKPHYAALPDQVAKGREYEATRQRDATAERERNRARAAQKQAWVDARHDWGAWWERQRRAEDNADIKAWKPKVWPHCRLDRKPPRNFVGGYCRACGSAWLYYAQRAQSPYCAPCAATRRRRPGSWRAKQHGARTEPIIPRRVFERDQWRCKICGLKTHGAVPALRAPTLDHIIPLSRGGSHTYDNLQCACYECNCHIKRDGVAKDQLLLIG